MRLRVTVDDTLVIETTPQAIEHGICDHVDVNLAVQCAYRTMTQLNVRCVIESTPYHHVRIDKITE